MAYNALLQTLPGQNSASFSAPFSGISAPLSAPAAPSSIAPLALAATSGIAPASNYEYMPLLKRNDYLQVRFWDKTSFLNALSGKNATTFGSSSNTAKIETTDYLEDENSTPLTDQKRGAIYGHARRVWNTYLQKSGRFPPTYSALDLDTLGQFRSEMERHFFELRLCDNHWKADEVWIRNYHSWRSSAEKQSGMAKMEVQVSDDPNPVVRRERPRPRKRKRDRSPSIPSKKTNQSTTNNATMLSDALFAPFDPVPQAATSSASGTQNAMPPPSPASHLIAVDVSPVLSLVADAVSSSPVSNNSVLESDAVIPVAPDDSGPLRATSCLPLETLPSSHAPLSESPASSCLPLEPLPSNVPLTKSPAPCLPLEPSPSHAPLTQSPTDSHLSGTSQLSANNETLSAAVSLSLLAQPANCTSCRSCCSIV